MENNAKGKKVVIVGGGFAGIEAAQYVGKHTDAEVIMVTKNPSFQYYPSLYRLVVGASVNQVSLNLRDILPKNVQLVIDTYTSLDQAKKTITLQSGAELAYDFLVLALGSEPNYFGIVGLQENAKDFLSINKALDLKKYFNDTLIAAKQLPEAEAQKKLHTIIVGAGPSGVEMSGALQAYLVTQAKKIGLDSKLISVDLLDSSVRVLPAIPPKGSALVERQLKKNGVNFIGNHGVKSYANGVVTATDKSTGTEITTEIPAGTVIWTAGTKINTAFSTIPNVVMTDRKRVQVSPTLTLPNDDSVYIAGDGSGTQYSGLAQTAVDQGRYVGKAIAARLKGQTVAPYEQRPGMFVIPVGKYWAILNYKTAVLSGYPAYLVRILADIQYFWSISSLGQVLKMIRKHNENRLG